MENVQEPLQPTENPANSPTYRLSYAGEGWEFFKVLIVNWLLTVVTVGLYYPWAKARQLQYLYGHTRLNKEPFTFHGTGKEMFMGFIKAILLLGGLYGLFFFFLTNQASVLALLLFYAVFLSLIPIAIHGSYRYRMSRTSWRGIRFGYRGSRSELFRNFWSWVFLTVITFGLYAPFLTNNLRIYIWDHVRFGNLRFEFNGSGSRYFILFLGGYILTIFTLGIYSFWWIKNLFNFYVNNMEIVDPDFNRIKLRSTATAGSFFELLVINLLLTVLTLGLAYPWVVNRSMAFMAFHIRPEGNIDLDQLVQSEENYRDATADDIGDLLDIDFII